MYKIFNEEIYEKVSEENKEILDDYVMEMKSRKKSPKTIEQYVSDIKRFYCWNYTNNKNKSILTAKKRLFRKYFLDLQEAGAGSARINRQQSSLRNLLNFLAEDDDIYDEYEMNAMQYIKGVPQETIREIIFLSNEQVEMLVNELINREKYKIAMFVSLAYDSVGRKAEIAQVTRESFEGDGNQTNEVIGKRAKRFKLRYFSRTKDIYDKYIKEKDMISGPLFYYYSKGEITPLDSDSYYPWCIKCRQILEELTGEYLFFNVHSFRHSGLENYNNGTHYALKELGKEKFDVQELKLLANHADIATTQGYLKDKDLEMENSLFSI